MVSAGQRSFRGRRERKGQIAQSRFTNQKRKTKPQKPQEWGFSWDALTRCKRKSAKKNDSQQLLGREGEKL